MKNRYIGRTFIAPNQEMRALGVRMKLNPLRDNIAGKRLVVVDDSIVRGTTTRAHGRACCARPARPRCTCASRRRRTGGPASTAWTPATGASCIAANMSVEEIRDYLNVDSLAYLALDRLLSPTGAVGAGFCDACLTGDYPVEVPVSLRKDVLEDGLVVAAPVPLPGMAVLSDDEATLPAAHARRPQA